MIIIKLTVFKKVNKRKSSFFCWQCENNKKVLDKQSGVEIIEMSMKILSAFRYHFITNSLSIIVWFSTQKSRWFFRARLIFTRSFSLLFSPSPPWMVLLFCSTPQSQFESQSERERYCVFHNLNGSDYTCSESPIMAHFHFYAILFFVNHRFGLTVCSYLSWTAAHTALLDM